LDAADKHYVKRIPVDGGSPETVVKSDVGKFALSPDGAIALTENLLRLLVTPIGGRRSPTQFIPVPVLAKTVISPTTVDQ
jgi:hypothetical protein